ncbi:Uma2 family endonuclease [Streptomyces diastatochromogenes]|nr:Uma2 family endonuclease [Streptomyces diastatochromogenes]
MSEAQAEFPNEPDLDEVLWQAWKAMELPEGYRAEIIEGAIEVSPTARLSHGLIANRVRRALDKFLDGGEYACHQVVNVIHNRKAWIPDVFVAPEDTESCSDEDDMGSGPTPCTSSSRSSLLASATRTVTVCGSVASTPEPEFPST